MRPARSRTSKVPKPGNVNESPFFSVLEIISSTAAFTARSAAAPLESVFAAIASVCVLGTFRRGYWRINLLQLGEAQVVTRIGQTVPEHVKGFVLWLRSPGGRQRKNCDQQKAKARNSFHLRSFLLFVVIKRLTLPEVQVCKVHPFHIYQEYEGQENYELTLIMLRSVIGSLCVPRYSCVSPSFIISDAQGRLGISVFGLFGHFLTVFLTFWSQNTGGKGGKEDKSGIRDYGRASIAVVIT